MPYTGSGKNTYWGSIGYNGVANPTILSEFIPVVTDGTTTYKFEVTACISTATWASGYTVVLNFYQSDKVTSTGSTTSVNSGSLSAGILVTKVTSAITAPANSAFCQASLQLVGSPATTNLLQVFEAQVLTGANTSQPVVVNQNYAFIHSADPWTSVNSALIDWNIAPLVAADGTFDSLVIDNIIELMGGAPGVQSQVPELVDPTSGNGSVFKIAFPGGTVGVGGQGPYDLGTAQPTADLVESLLLDGERPFGARASNRTLTVPVVIFGPTLATMTAARELLLRTVDQQTWKLTWKPAYSGQPLEFDCFRANPSVVTYGFGNNDESGGGNNPANWAITVVTLSFQALPYGRSGEDGLVQVDFLDGTLDAGTITPQVTLDNFSSVSGTGWTLNTAYAFGSSNNAFFSQAIPVKNPFPAAVYTKAGTWNLTKLPILTAWFGQSYDNQWTPDKNFVSNITLHWTLTDTNGKKLTFSGTQNKCKWGPNPGKPAWTRIAATIPQGKTKAQFDYSRVTQYSVKITNWHGDNTYGLIRMHAWLSQIVAHATTVKWIDTPHAHIYSVFGLANMARSPMSAEIQLPATNPITHELTQTNTWTVPKGVTQVTAECWGGGGGGGSVSGVTNGLYCGGGGGGEYAAESVVAVIPGTAVPFTIGSGGIGGQVVQRSSTFGTPGSNNWTCPTGVSVISVKMWGGGAAGGAGAGGGGGGAYTEGTVNVTAGTTYEFTVGKGGVPNSGKLSKDQALRHGGDTVVRGDTGALHAHGGSSAITGGTNGGIGGTRITVAESGTTITSALNGGNGGNSPGNAGGGGGASGNNTPANGNRGGDSPKGANNYGTGGPGGTAAGNGGGGGAGANLNGVPGQGVIPGGGGGGGFTSSSGTNNNGAYGANGKIIINYQQNAGNPINGGTTTFGQAGLTNKTVTAHGGSSPSLSSATGGAGGTGSANTTHFNGGSGSMSGNNSDYIFKTADLGGPFTKLGQATATATSVTTGASALSLSTGIAIISAVTSVLLDVQHAVTDSAGNTYDFVANQLISGTVYQYVWMSQIGTPITGSTTATLANNGVSATMTISWLGSPYYADIDQATVATTSANSTSPGISSFSNANVGTHQGYLAIVANNSTTVVSAGPGNPGSFAGTTQGGSETSLGTADICWLLKEVPGASSGTSALTATYGGAVNWSAVLLPVIPQDSTSPTLVKVASTSSTGTSITLSTAAFPITAGTGYMMLFCEFAGAPGTVSFTDSGGNTWTQRNTVAAGTATLRAYSAPLAFGYTTGGSVVLNDTTSQAHVAALYYIPGATGVDTALDKTATGTSTSPAITLNSGTSPNDLEIVIIANNNSVDTNSNPSGWVPFSLNNSGTMHSEPYAKKISGRSTATVTAGYLASQTWGIIALGFKTNIFGGSGGASGGPQGVGQDGTDNGGAAWSGGGKGADGITGSVGSGSPAAIPGGGGSGGGASDTSGVEGGSGGSGLVRLTWQPPLTTFNDFILHRPGVDSRKTLNPVVTIPPNDPPDNREYAVPSLISGINAEFWGTYTVLAVANAWNSATTGSSRRLSVTINQYEYKNGPVVSAQCTRVVTPATDIVNGYVSMGEITLPIKDYDPGNDEVYYTVSIHDTDQTDSFQDVLFLDTAGQTVICNIAPGTAADHQYSSFYVNEPSFDRALGQVLGSRHGREKSVSVLDMSLLTGGPLYLDSGDNLLLAYSTGGAPNLGVTYQPRWYTDRTK